jgi:hypothetical protein
VSVTGGTTTIANASVVIDNSLVIGADGTLDGTDGVIKSSLDGGISVAGTLKGKNIHLTAVADDSVGGDADADGSASIPFAGAWPGILGEFGGTIDITESRIAYPMIAIHATSTVIAPGLNGLCPDGIPKPASVKATKVLWESYLLERVTVGGPWDVPCQEGVSAPNLNGQLPADVGGMPFHWHECVPPPEPVPPPPPFSVLRWDAQFDGNNELPCPPLWTEVEPHP